MRLEATIPDSRGNAVLKAAEELGLRRSQLIDEALALFLKAITEAKRGRRVVVVDPETSETVIELSSPTLTALEWALNPQPLKLSGAELASLRSVAESPTQPNERLKAAAKSYKASTERKRLSG
ncbi:MAG: hypothetical protein AB7K71_12160 [Polyangiaceae bacterium]